MEISRKRGRLPGLAILLLLLILIPFALYEESILRWTEAALHAERSRWIVAAIIGALLAGDVVLPVPSSLVGAASGALLGFGAGTAVSWAGMCLGCLLGYGLGRSLGHPFAWRFVGEREWQRVSALTARYGFWMLAVCRAVPVLAEASVLLAGVMRLPFRPFLATTALSNLGIAAVYAAVGAFSFQAGSFLLAFAGAIALPFLAMQSVGRKHLP